MQPIIREIGGARLFCIPTDKFKSEYFSLRFTLPLCEETVQHTTLLTSVLGRGTSAHPTKLAINRYLDELYSTSISARNQRIGDMQRIGFSADLLGSRYVGGKGILPAVIDAVAELFYRPYLEDGFFCTEYVESEKNNLRDAIRATINNPRSYARARCRRLLCAGEPFALSLIGEECGVDGITPRSLTERYQTLLEDATPVFFYVGSTPAEEVAAMIRHSFPRFHGKNAPYRADIKRHHGAPVRGEEAMPLCQGKLSIGFRTDASIADCDAPAMLLLNELFGGSPASKLFLNVREKRSLCYHCSSELDLYKGVMFANAGMTPGNRAITEEAMLTELAAIGKGDITATEFEAAKRSLDHSYRQTLDNPAALSSFYSGRALIGSTETVEDFRLRVAAVTVSDVVDAASRVDLGAIFFLNGTLEGEEDEE